MYLNAMFSMEWSISWHTHQGTKTQLFLRLCIRANTTIFKSLHIIIVWSNDYRWSHLLRLHSTSMRWPNHDFSISASHGLFVTSLPELTNTGKKCWDRFSITNAGVNLANAVVRSIQDDTMCVGCDSNEASLQNNVTQHPAKQNNKYSKLIKCHKFRSVQKRWITTGLFLWGCNGQW